MEKSTWEAIVKLAKEAGCVLTEQKRYTRIQMDPGKDVRRLYLPHQHEPGHLDVAGWEPELAGVEKYSQGKEPSGSVRCRFKPREGGLEGLMELLLQLRGPVTVELKKAAPKGRPRPSLSAYLAASEDA